MKLSNIALALFAVPAAFASLAVRDPTPVEVADLSARAASPAVDSEQNLDERTLGLLLGGVKWWLDNFTNGRCNDGNKIVECARQDMCVWNNQCSYKNKPVYPGGSLWKYKCSSTAVLKCWNQNKGCRSDCVCEEVVTPPPVPTVTPTQPACSKLQVLQCACRGLAIRPDCGCGSCSCSQQSLCQRQKGTLDHSTCKCIYPSQTWRRRDLQPDNLCPKPQTACRLDALSTGWDGKFECVDTTSNLESCGGCATEGLGQDCTAIEGAADVACVSGKCVVSSCQKGFKVADGTCIPVSTGSQKVMGSPVWSA